MRRWSWVLPLIGVVVVSAIPFVRYAQKSRSESEAAEVLRAVHVAQEGFRNASSGSYATALESLLQPCPEATFTPPSADSIASLRAAGYDVELRMAEGATTAPADCHGRPTTSNYYASTAPRTVDSPGQQAFAMTASGRIYVFFDGVAPVERDMAPGGLATPLESVPNFKIP
jgi:type II secretory pathway pseudopilin PulG